MNRKSVNKKDEGLQSPDYWDFDSGELHPPVPGGAKAELVITFTSDDLQRVAACARPEGKCTIQFRSATLCWSERR